MKDTQTFIKELKSKSMIDTNLPITLAKIKVK